MNPKNWITGKATWPRGGDPAWQADNLAGQLLRDEFFGPPLPPPSGGDGYVPVWLGASFVRKPVKTWTGAAWGIKPAKRRTATDWVTT